MTSAASSGEEATHRASRGYRERVRFSGRGHPHIRATHAKTLEFSIDADITERATCVVAVDIDAEPLEALAGPIRISVGVERFTLDAVANPSWDPSTSAVIRRSSLRLPGTFATEATGAAADLPRDLVAALRGADALVTIEVVPVASALRTVVLFAADASNGGDARLRAELDRADRVVPEDAEARRLAPRRDGDGARTLVVATHDMPGRGSVADLAAADRVETVGLPPALAAAAASPTDGPLLIASPGASARDLLRSTPVTHRLTLGVEHRDLGPLLADARRLRGSSHATVAQPFAPPLRVTDTVPELPSRDTVYVCFDARMGVDVLGPGVRAAIEGLLADGVPTKAAARALTTLTGWPRRRAYDAVLGLAAPNSRDR